MHDARAIAGHGKSLPAWLLMPNRGDGFGVARDVRIRNGPLVVLAWATLLAVGCAPASRPGQQGGAVPWDDRPAPTYVPPPQPVPRAAYPPCQARQLAGGAGRGGPAAGTVYQEVRLTNRSDRSCTLAAGPTAVIGVPVTGGTTTLTRVARGEGFNIVGPARQTCDQVVAAGSRCPTPTGALRSPPAARPTTGRCSSRLAAGACGSISQRR